MIKFEELYSSLKELTVGAVFRLIKNKGNGVHTVSQTGIIRMFSLSTRFVENETYEMKEKR